MTAIDELERDFELYRSKTPKPKNYFPKKGRGSFGRLRSETKPIFKQVVIKTIGRGLNNVGTERVLEYIARGADTITLEDENGEEKTVNEIYDTWKEKFSPNTNGRVSKEAMHLIFSIDEDINLKNLEALKQSVRDVLKMNLYEYHHALVVHTHQNKPHVHVILNKRSMITGKKLHFKNRKHCKDFFTQMREDFKESLNYHNKEFHYENRFKVDRDLELGLLQEYIQKVNREHYIFKQIARDAKNNVSRLETKKEEVTSKIKNVLGEIKATTALSFSLLKNNDTVEIERAYNDYDKLKRKQEFFKKREEEQSLLLTTAKSAAQEIKPTDLLQKLKMIEYFEMPQHKKLLTRKQRQTLAALKRSYGFAKLNFIRQMESEFGKHEKEIEGLVQKTNAFALMKHLRNIDERIALMEVLQDDTHLERLEKNRDFILDVMQKRFLQNEKTKAYVQRKLKVAETEKEKTDLKKTLEFLNAENKLMKKQFSSTVQHALELGKQEEVQKISKSLEVEFDQSQSVDEFLLEHRPAYEAKQKAALERYAARISKELRVEIGEMETQAFVDKYNPRYKFFQDVARAKKIGKRLKLDVDVSLMSTQGVRDFLETHKETYNKIVREGIESFVQKVADEHGQAAPEQMQQKSNKELFDWIEIHNVRSPSRRLLEKLAKQKLAALNETLEKQRAIFEKREELAKARPDALRKLEVKIANVENVLKKTESITPIFQNDIKVLDEALAKRIVTQKAIKEIPITMDATPCTPELVSTIRDTLPKLALEQEQVEKIEKYLYFATKKAAPIAKSYLKKHGFLDQESFKDVKFEPYEKMALSVKMPAIQEALAKEMQAKNIVLEKTFSHTQKRDGHTW